MPEFWEHTIRNFKGTLWEHIRKQGKLKKKNILPFCTLRAWLHFPLVGWNFSPPKGSSHFFAWAITPRNKHPGYIGEKGTILGKTYGFDTRCYWEHPWGTHWKLGEQLGNTVGTHEQLIKKNSPPFPWPSKPKLKSWDPWMYVAPSHWLQGIWDKSEEVWKKCWGKYWEPIGNLKGT